MTCVADSSARVVTLPRPAGQSTTTMSNSGSSLVEHARDARRAAGERLFEARDRGRIDAADAEHVQLRIAGAGEHRLERARRR